jgi:hypothetical protein
MREKEKKKRRGRKRSNKKSSNDHEERAGHSSAAEQRDSDSEMKGDPQMCATEGRIASECEQARDYSKGT